MKVPTFTTVFRVFAVCYLALRITDMAQTVYGISQGYHEINPLYPYTGIGGIITLNAGFMVAILLWALMEGRTKIHWARMVDGVVLGLLIIQSVYVVVSNFRLI